MRRWHVYAYGCSVTMLRLDNSSILAPSLLMPPSKLTTVLHWGVPLNPTP